MGRQTVWEKYHIADKLTKLEMWSRNGATDIEIAEKLGIGLTTLYKLKKDFPEFAEALKRGKEDADFEVENSLFKRANGYEYEESTTEIRMDDTGNPKPALIRKTKRIIPGDVTAMIFWLKNRKPEMWRDKQFIEQEDNSFMQMLRELGKEMKEDGTKGSDS